MKFEILISCKTNKLNLLYNVGGSKDGICCAVLRLEAKPAGKADVAQHTSTGEYYQDPWLTLNEYPAYKHKYNERSLMMDKRFGWRVCNYK